MKRIIICTLIVAFAYSSFGQQSALTRQDYLKKSKNQKTVAWVLAGGGAALIITGLVIGNKDEVSFNDATSGATFIIIGAIPVVASIPFFVASGKNKRRAMQASAYFKKENSYFTRSFSKVRTCFPALTFKIAL